MSAMILFRDRTPEDRKQKQRRLLLALKSLTDNETNLVAKAARFFEVPRSTLQHRINGRQSVKEMAVSFLKFTQVEELSIKTRILSLDARGASPRPKDVKEMANRILQTREQLPGDKVVGANWVSNFLKRNVDLKTTVTRRLDYQRAKMEDPRVIGKWFDLLKRTRDQYNVDRRDIFNFDETGFAMGQVSCSRVVTRSDFKGKRSRLQPGSREWVTAIECTNALGWYLPPVIVIKGKNNLTSFFPIDQGARIEPSPNGWTNDDISVRWLKNVFIPHTSDQVHGKYRLLIMDGHGSHLTSLFNEICTENFIVPLCMPPHSSHLLQPLDVGSFSPLKQSYKDRIEEKMKYGVQLINKLEFLEVYFPARHVGFTSKAIVKSFATAGIEPFNPSRVLSKLTIRLRTPTPEPEDTSTFIPHTPKSRKEFQQQKAAIHDVAASGADDSMDSVISLIDQAFKGCEAQLIERDFFQTENQRLLHIEESRKEKKSRVRKQLKNMTCVSNEDVLERFPGLFQLPASRGNLPNEQIARLLGPNGKPLRKCGICKEAGHRRETCPEKRK